MTMRKIVSLPLLLTLIALSFIFLTSCEVDYYQEPEGNQDQGSGSSLFGDGVTIPAGFDWATIKSGKLTVKVDDRFNGQYYYMVEVFDANPIFSQDAQLLAKGVAKQGLDYVVTADFPTALETAWVRQTDPSGKSVVMAMDVSSTSGSQLDFGVTASSGTRSSATASMQASFPVTATDVVNDYPTPTTDVEEIDYTQSSITLSPSYWPERKHKAYVIKEDYTGEIIFEGGDLGVSLYIEGRWTNTSTKEITLGDKDKFILQSGGVFATERDFSIKGSNGALFYVANGGIFNQENKGVSISSSNASGEIINKGLLKATSISIPSSGKLYNEGFLKVGSLTANSSSSITNKGDFIISEAFSMPSTGNFYNWGTFEVYSITTGGSTIENYQTFSVKNEATFGSGAKVFNYCHFTSPKVTTSGATVTSGEESLFSTNELLSGGSTFILKEHAILEVKQIATFTTWANTIQGSDGEADYALARLKEVVSQGHNGITYNNKVEVECSYHTSNKTFYTLNSPLARMVREGESTVDIPATECNDGGNNNVAPGTPANPVFPIIYEGAGLTYLFEDNWPYLGDYDMNDLVLDVQPTYSLNSSNNVTELKLDVTLRAVGATKRLAVGIQLDGISSEAISTVSRTNTAGINGNVFTQSNGLETGQEFAVIPVFDDAHQALGHSSPLITNTVKGSANNVSPARVIFTIDFSNNPLDQADITVDKFNVFIINGGYSAKRSEVHMAGFQPTGKADKGRFGFADSDSNENPYKSENNMIWGLAIPGPAKYPVEWSSITESYLALELWAKSGGSENKDWYKSPVGNKIYE